MSVAATSALQSQNLSSIMQQLLSGSNAQSTSELSPTVLETLLQNSGAATQTATQTTTELPAAITQALGNLLSGSSPSTASADLSTLQNYFKANPASLTSLLSSLQDGAGTYGADGTVSSSSSLLASLGLDSSSGSSTSSSLISQLLGTQSQDPLLASLGSASSGTGFSLLG
jgi:hypothetical protein